MYNKIGASTGFGTRILHKPMLHQKNLRLDFPARFGMPLGMPLFSEQAQAIFPSTILILGGG
jgi:hypothetical protein